MGAVATTLAAGVALLLPFVLAYFERSKKERERRSVVQEVCSAVDRISAYHEVANLLLANEIIYHPQHRACERISENAIDLRRALEILIRKPELSDGAVTAAASAERVAECLTKALATPYGLNQGDWDRRRAALNANAMAAQNAALRSKGVRASNNLGPSTAAAKIRQKYLAIIDDCNRAKQTQTAPTIVDIDDTAY